MHAGYASLGTSGLGKKHNLGLQKNIEETAWFGDAQRRQPGAGGKKPHRD